MYSIEIARTSINEKIYYLKLELNWHIHLKGKQEDRGEKIYQNTAQEFKRLKIVVKGPGK